MTNNLDLFCSILSRETGLDFPISRYSFIQNRLEPILERYKCSNPSELIIKSKFDIKIKIDIVNALTTNETWFFRHPKHFEILKRDIFPKIIKENKNKPINIWSAGCSIGAELYSILITLIDAFPDFSKYRVNILGSDISYNSIQSAKKGIYTIRDLKETNDNIKNKYFDIQDDGTFKIKEDLKKYVNFEYLNLLESWPPRTFNIIFCRNTMIYFNNESKKNIVKRFYKSLEPGGYFFTSANELIDNNYDNISFNKLFIRDEYIYQKSNRINGDCELYFKNSTELLRATNLLRRFSYKFQFGKATNNGINNNIRSIIVSYFDYEKIIKLLTSNSIEPYKQSVNYR